MSPTITAPTADELLLDEMAGYFSDPLGFVMGSYPWGEPGSELENEAGPDDNQKQFLIDLGEQVRERGFNGTDPVMPILMTETSGHGTGKSAMGAWIADWILSTRPDSIGTVTAGSWQQLETRTWAAIQHWTKLCITADWFIIQAHGIYHKRRPKTWKILAQACKEENAQSFAGQHARTSTSWYLFDEASLIPDKVWTVAHGGLSDGHAMFFAWGQCERSTGRFYEINFGVQEHRWNHRTVDSRSSRLTNKALIEQDILDYGIDSDHVRVRIRGLAPTADELQFIDRARILGAQQRTVTTFADDPLIAGFDASGGGSAWNVVRFRRGRDATMAPVRVPGEQSRDREALLARIAGLMKDDRPGHKIAVLFVDSAFGSPYVERLHVLGYKNVIEVNFGGHSPDRHQANQRAYMWNQMKEWLPHGAIPPADEKLALDLAGPGASIRVSDGKLVLESKADMQKRGQASPDDGDALALTWAAPVGPVEKEVPDEEEEFAGVSSWGSNGWMR